MSSPSRRDRRDRCSRECPPRGSCARRCARRDLDVLLGAPARDRRARLRCRATRAREHATVRARERRDGARDVGALEPEAAARIVRRLDRAFAARARRHRTSARHRSRRVSLTRRFSPLLNASSDVVDLAELEAPSAPPASANVFPARKQSSQPGQRSRRGHPTRRGTAESARATSPRRASGARTPVAATDGELERLQRGDVAHADVAIAVARRLRGIRLAAPTRRTSDHAEQHGNDGDARGDRAAAAA